MIYSTAIRYSLARKRRYNGMLRFVSTNATITPAITLSAGASTPQWEVTESNGVTYSYSTAGFTHNRVVAGNITVRLLNTEDIKSYVTEIDFNSDGIISSFWDLQIYRFTLLVKLYLNSNNFTGDLSGWVLPVSLVDLYLNNNNSFTGDLSGWVLPVSLVRLYLNSNNFTGDLSGWILPVSLVDLRVYNNSFTGDLSGWVLSTSLVALRIYSSHFSAGPVIFVGSSPITIYRADSNGIVVQQKIDDIINSIYQNRMNFTYATPSLNVGGTNVAPSAAAIAQIVILQTDPSAEGFNKWTVTYTAP